VTTLEIVILIVVVVLVLLVAETLVVRGFWGVGVTVEGVPRAVGLVSADDSGGRGGGDVLAVIGVFESLRGIKRVPWPVQRGRGFFSRDNNSSGGDVGCSDRGGDGGGGDNGSGGGLGLKALAVAAFTVDTVDIVVLECLIGIERVERPVPRGGGFVSWDSDSSGGRGDGGGGGAGAVYARAVVAVAMEMGRIVAKTGGGNGSRIFDGFTVAVEGAAVAGGDGRGGERGGDGGDGHGVHAAYGGREDGRGHGEDSQQAGQDKEDDRLHRVEVKMGDVAGVEVRRKIERVSILVSLGRDRSK